MFPIVVFNTYRNMKVGSQVDFDGKFEFQCVDLMRDYAKYAKYPAITNYGHAISLWNQGLGNNYTREYNSINAIPPIGAIIFWKRGEYGHLAIGGRANALWVEIIEQNGGRGSGDGEGNDAIRFRKDYYKNCLGWFIPKK